VTATYTVSLPVRVRAAPGIMVMVPVTLARYGRGVDKMALADEAGGVKARSSGPCLGFRNTELPL
jgi:hypothetical protein